MTARPPVETPEASSEESSESPEIGDAQAGGEDEDIKTEVRTAGAAKVNRTEPSMSRTLEAILSKSDADDDLSVPPQDGGGSIGTKTLLGIGASGLPLPGKASPSTDDEQSFSVEDVFDDEGTAVSSIKPNGKGRGGDDQVGDLLDEVAEALNTQAASHDSTVGALPGKPVPAARHIRADVDSIGRGEFEFEDPDDGPTTLNVHGGDSEDVDVGADDDDEAVVLGPAKLPRPLPARLPLPAAVAASASSEPARTATPFTGLAAATLPSFPAPASGRSRMPTPAPGQAIGLPPPGRLGVPPGTPVNGVPTASPQGDSSRRTSSGRRAAAGSERSAGHQATAAVMESLSSAMESASVVLKKDVKFRVASLAGVVLGTFVVGLLIGRAVIGSGKKTTAEASEAVAVNQEAKVAPAQEPAKAPADVPAPPAAAPPAPPNRAEALPAAPPPTAVAEVAPSDPPVVAEASQMPALHKRRARRANLVPKDDPLPKPVAGPSKPVAGPASRPKAAPPAPAGKKKSTWHDPFAD